jgi:SAM-dependent methyltransferase
MKALTEIKQRLVCPIHRSELQFDTTLYSTQGVPWPDGKIHCPRGCLFEIERGIPRFVSRDNYASAFGLQWQRYQKTQLDSHTGQPISQARLVRCLGMPLEMLKGKVVLEVGSGAGRFTELLIDKCNFLVSADLSEAVNANLRNCSGKNPYLLIQADINASPLPHRFFDVAICLGVIQHTPSPEQTIASLAQHVRPGGLLVIDHYTYENRFSVLGQFLTLQYPLRAVLKRLNPELGLKATIVLTAICDPIRKRTCKVPWLDRIACRVFPSYCYYATYTQLDPKVVYEWNELDTHDRLTTYYRHFRSREQIQSCLERSGFVNICSSKGGNGIEARGTYST